MAPPGSQPTESHASNTDLATQTASQAETQAPRGSSAAEGAPGGAARAAPGPRRPLAPAGDQPTQSSEATHLATASQPDDPQTPQGAPGTREPAEQRRCTACGTSKTENCFAPSHWAGTSGEARKRKCLHCAPRTTGLYFRFCSRCEQCKPPAQFRSESQKASAHTVPWAKNLECSACQSVQDREVRPPSSS